MKYSRNRNASKDERDCVFCSRWKTNDRILWQGEYFFLMANDFAYCEDHVMLLPKRHIETELAFTPFEEGEFLRTHHDIVIKFREEYGSCFHFRRENTPRQSMWHVHFHYTPHDNFLVIEDRIEPRITIDW